MPLGRRALLSFAGCWASLATSPAFAEDAPVAQRAREEPPLFSSPYRAPSPSVAVSIGLPLHFFYKEGGASLAFGFAEHFALRANFASYKPKKYFKRDDAGLTLGGRTSDVGLALVFYPRSLWNGMNLEIGGVLRARDVSSTRDAVSGGRNYDATDTTIYAVRALVGWSWYRPPFFGSVAVGFSSGVERGTEITVREMGAPVVDERVDRYIKEAETSFRLGFAFGL